ncbi:MAG: bifunctional DNA primase/polymerase [Polyangiaceae bacterium]|nr:bifunctional DNA primase/polymerase [Polyangiaceae bacterium]
MPWGVTRLHGILDASPARHATALTAVGWAVLPLHSAGDGRCTCQAEHCRSVGKHPRTRHGVADATVDPDVVAAWWRRWPDANIGVATGGDAGPVVVDIDPRNGGEDGPPFVPARSPPGAGDAGNAGDSGGDDTGAGSNEPVAHSRGKRP